MQALILHDKQEFIGIGIYWTLWFSFISTEVSPVHCVFNLWYFPLVFFYFRVHFISAL